MMVKTHLIVTEQNDDYRVKWVKKLIDLYPIIDSYGNFTFNIVVDGHRVEIKTHDMNYLIERAKKNTRPKGRGALTTDEAKIYIKEQSGKETLVAIVTHIHTRKYAPMYDEID